MDILTSVYNSPFFFAAWSLRLISELEDADQRAESVTNGLSSQQLEWQPGQGAWSIGQGLEHLLLTSEAYLPAISTALEAQQHATVQDVSLGWLSRWFFRNYAAPNPEGARAQAPRKIEPAKDVRPAIVQTFLQSNQSVRELVRRASEYDVNGIRFKNPFVPLLRFTVGAGLEIVAKHQTRHLLQAERVRQSAGFPN